MYSRSQSVNERKRLKIPENYRGNAFNESGLYSDIPPQIRDERVPSTTFEHNLDLRQNSELQHNDNISTPKEIDKHTESHIGTQNDMTGERIQSQDPIRETFSARQAQMYDTQPKTELVCSTPNAGASIFSSLFPPTLMSSHFPFGHGIGEEEILILGMMLIVYMSGENGESPDGELIMLLAILLFAG